MPSVTDFVAQGKVSEVRDDAVIFRPAATQYALELKPAGGSFTGPIGVPVEALIRAVARKVWTVPSGGLFVTPLSGPPKIIQGRVLHVEDRRIVLHAGSPFIIDLPEADTAYDLQIGGIRAGGMVNVTIFPGATIELSPQGAVVG